MNLLNLVLNVKYFFWQLSLQWHIMTRILPCEASMTLLYKYKSFKQLILITYIQVFWFGPTSTINKTKWRPVQLIQIARLFHLYLTDQERFIGIQLIPISTGNECHRKRLRICTEIDIRYSLQLCIYCPVFVTIVEDKVTKVM